MIRGALLSITRKKEWDAVMTIAVSDFYLTSPSLSSSHCSLHPLLPFLLALIHWHTYSITHTLLPPCCHSLTYLFNHTHTPPSLLSFAPMFNHTHTHTHMCWNDWYCLRSILLRSPFIPIFLISTKWRKLMQRFVIWCCVSYHVMLCCAGQGGHWRDLQPFRKVGWVLHTATAHRHYGLSRSLHPLSWGYTGCHHLRVAQRC